MPALLTLSSVALATPAGRPLFSNLTLAIGTERIGIVGRNGAGKSSLLRLMLGELSPAAGAVARYGTIGLLPQIVELGTDVAGALGVSEAWRALSRIEQGRGTATDIASADWSLPSRIDAALVRAGLGPVNPARRVNSFSGGEQTRLAMARLLLDPPDLLLLDEPTNHLDGAGRVAIADLLADWRGGAVVVSHDREVLETMDRIVGLAPTGVTVHGGGWSSWQVARAAARERAAADLERAARAVRTASRAAQDARERQARRDCGGRAYAASGSATPILMGRQRERAENTGGRGQSLARLQQEEAGEALAAARSEVEVVTPLTIALPPCGLPAHRQVLAFDSVSWAAGGRAVLSGLTFALRGPERVALTGRNGAGKSTVLRLAAGLIEPASGQVTRLPQASALLDQRVGLLALDRTLLDNLRRQGPALSENAARAALARFAFRNVEADRLAGVLSGGERLRAGLACVLSAHPVPQLLLLDEPTNHLDLESIEVIEQALRGYDGALLVVSHDPAFLGAIGVTREIAL